MYRRLHHVDWAVKDAQAAAKHFAQALGLATSHFYTNLAEGYRSAFIPLGQCPIELMDATDETGPVARFLKGRGDGIYLAALEVDDIQRTVDFLQRQGVRTLEGKRAPGQEMGRYVFIHPLDAHGVLLELNVGAMPQPASGTAVPGRKGGIKRVSGAFIAVKDLDKAVDTYTRRLGFPRPEVGRLEQMGARNAVFHLGNDVYELLQPIDPQSPMSRFLEKRGEGIYMIGLEVADLAAEVREMKAHGVRFTEMDVPIGDRMRHIAVIHPASAYGAPLQLMEG